ncbi:MAG: ChrB domain protein [Haloplasmataceae bacterium]|nr:ChrB domain protein [Haloplasmataceae bacterium]
MEQLKWLVITYNLPTEPSRYRVATWRALKKLGALNIQQSMWFLAYNEDHYKALQNIIHEIEMNGGEAYLMISTIVETKKEEKIISAFNNIRNEEYAEYINECNKYIKELEKEIKIEKFTFAELDEEEEEFQKLVTWYQKIEIRDLFHASKREYALNSLDQIKKAIDEFSELVYKHNNS